MALVAFSARSSKASLSRTARAQAAVAAAQAETCRIRADTEKMLTDFLAGAVPYRNEMRTDLPARPERAERRGHAYRGEVVQLRATIGTALPPLER